MCLSPTQNNIWKLEIWKYVQNYYLRQSWIFDEINRKRNLWKFIGFSSTCDYNASEQFMFLSRTSYWAQAYKICTLVHHYLHLKRLSFVPGSILALPIPYMLYGAHIFNQSLQFSLFSFFAVCKSTFPLAQCTIP